MKIKEEFDAVKMMREIRDELSKKFMNMTFKEQKKYIQEQLKSRAKVNS